MTEENIWGSHQGDYSIEAVPAIPVGPEGPPYPWKVVETKTSRKPSERQAKARARIRDVVLDAYGPECVCCGETIRRFLTIDHVNNDGAEHRRQLRASPWSGSIYAWLIANEFPDIVQILCYNCNLGRAKNDGICPHKDEVSS